MFSILSRWPAVKFSKHPANWSPTGERMCFDWNKCDVFLNYVCSIKMSEWACHGLSFFFFLLKKKKTKTLAHFHRTTVGSLNMDPLPRERERGRVTTAGTCGRKKTGGRKKRNTGWEQRKKNTATRQKTFNTLFSGNIFWSLRPKFSTKKCF